MTESSTLTSTVAGRYATALFELALESGDLAAAEADAAALGQALGTSDDLMRMIRSPLYTREQQGAAIAAVGAAMGLSGLAQNLLGLMAGRRRLFVLPEVLATFATLVAAHRGELTAEVTAARPLSDAQSDALRARLHEALAREVKLNVTVDPSIIGGLVVKVGSRMIDTSIRARLAGLQNAMREVG